MRKKTTFFLIGIILCSFQMWAQESRVVNVPTPGTLSTILGTDKDLISDLTVTGTINDVDFQTIKQMRILKVLNMQLVDIVNGAIPDNVFTNKVMENITLPNSLQKIGNSVFSNATLSYLSFQNCQDLNQIGHSAFYMTNLRNNLLNFSSCENLSVFGTWQHGGTFAEYNGHVILPTNMIEIPYMTFCKFKGRVTLPTYLEKIGNHAFAEAIPSHDITIPNTVIEIGEGAFRNITINHLYFWSSLKKIGNNAFSNAKIKDILLPFTIEIIGSNAFYNCTELEEITCNNPTPPQLGTNVFYNVDKFNCKIKVPDQSIHLYQDADQWRDFFNIISRSDTPTDMDWQSDDIKLNIFPNPFIDVLNIESLEAVKSINIYYENGQQIKISNDINYPIDMSGCPSGMYLINIQTENNTYTRKIIKK